MTRRDGPSVEIGVFDRSAPIVRSTPPARSAILSVAGFGFPSGETIKSDVSQLIWSVAETLGHLSCLFRLEPGDVIHGTPEGVGPAQAEMSRPLVSNAWANSRCEWSRPGKMMQLTASSTVPHHGVCGSRSRSRG